MLLLNIKNVSYHIGDRPILANVNLQIKKGNKMALVGRNGTGKSTLLKIIANEIATDSGTIERSKGLRIARLEQETDLPDEGSVFDAVAAHFKGLKQNIQEYEALSQSLGHSATPKNLQRLESLQHKIEAQDGWQIKHRIESTLSRLGLEPLAAIKTLSGGYRRRVALARAITSEPDLLLLDEPTNHLDIQSICWLEEFMLNYSGSFILITHDRQFLNNVVNTTVEINQCRLISFPGNYNAFMQRREALLEAKATQQALFEKRLAQEEAWIREGVKARRTRNQGRVKKLVAMRKTHQQRIRATGNITLEKTLHENSGNLVIEAKHIHYAYDGITYINDFNAVLMRGEKIGIVGPNGCGKSTLLKLLTQEAEPISGTIRHGTRLKIRYFDQDRSHLDEQKTVLENLGEGRTFIEFNGKSKHIIGYLQDFLFSPDRANLSAKYLSGGEKARLLLAKLFSYPSNLIVMDEPTNDLDIETIELLEEILTDYQGTVLLVSHDRQFMENIVTFSWVFEGQRKIVEHPGDFHQWDALFSKEKIKLATAKNSPRTTASSPPADTKKIKLSYKEQQELKQLPETIEQLEQTQEKFQSAINGPEFYKEDQERVQATLQSLEKINQQIEQAMQRWEILEDRIA